MRPSRMIPPQHTGAVVSDGQAQLPARLAALEQLTRIGSERGGPDGFPPELLASASDLLVRAGQRLRMSAGQTVVSLAGGTGSGKSSLFNLLAGAEFSPAGVTRPMTREPHACAWEMSGADPLLDWLGVPQRHRYARASELGGSDHSLAGLILVDVPDHDSVLGHGNQFIDHLVSSSDVIIWVLDPQKYADSAVHREFLIPLGGHADVVAVVLNQCDLLTEAQTEDCVTDLRRLLDSEGVPDVPVLVSSAVTGQGLGDLRALLNRAVTARHAVSARLAADVGKTAAGFAPFAVPPAAAGDGGPAGPDGFAPDTAASELGDALAEAAGAEAVGDLLRSARELRAADYVGWPAAGLRARLTSRGPRRRVQLGALRQQLLEATAAASGTHEAAIDSALTLVADSRMPPLPPPWSRTVREALRSSGPQVPDAVGAELRAAVPSSTTIEPWWRWVGVAQGLLLGCFVVGVCWLICLLILGAGGVAPGAPAVLSRLWLLPVAVVVAAGGLAGGWLTARAARKAVSRAALRESEALSADIRKRLTVVARVLVVTPAERELTQLRAFREQLRVAAADEGPAEPEARTEAAAAGQPEEEAGSQAAEQPEDAEQAAAEEPDAAAGATAQTAEQPEAEEAAARQADAEEADAAAQAAGQPDAEDADAAAETAEQADAEQPEAEQAADSDADAGPSDADDAETAEEPVSARSGG